MFVWRVARELSFLSPYPFIHFIHYVELEDKEFPPLCTATFANSATCVQDVHVKRAVSQHNEPTPGSLSGVGD